MTTTVTWVRDSEGVYEISSVEHLKQLMNKGSLYTDAGTRFAYWSSGTLIDHYRQTVDIDLMGDSTDIRPIGNFNDPFHGDYDGGNFKILNWSYVDPNFSTTNDNETAVGLFGSTEGSLKNIRLGGTWTIQGFHDYAGFLAAYASDSSPTSEYFNIECDFDLGSSITMEPNGSPRSFGAILGDVEVSQLVGMTLKGNVDFGTMVGTNAGGVIGELSIRQDSGNIQNLATFPSGISSSSTAGGVIASFTGSASLTNCINAMFGDLFCDNHRAGGVIGLIQMIQNTSPCDNLINAMTGNISNTGDRAFNSVGSAGGVIGDANGESFSGIMNYMTGDILQTGNTARQGGLIGTLLKNSNSSSSTLNLTSSINAMNGSVYNSVSGETISSIGSNFSLLATVDTSFGLSFVVDNHSTTSAPTGLLTNTDFPDLPYIDLDATDGDGNSYSFDFVYANLSGNSSHNSYTHLVLHRGVVATPFRINFDVPENNTTLFATFANASTETFLQPALTLVVVTSLIIPRSVNLPITILEVDGATSYNITYQGPTGDEITAFSAVTTLEHNITGLEPNTQYTIRIYADTGSGHELAEELTSTTLANTAENYDISDFEENGIFNISSLTESTIANLNEVIDELFETGDIVRVAIRTDPSLDTSFINLGDTLSIREINGVLLPFETTSGLGQDVNVILSDDSTTVGINYDETVNSITVQGVEYFPGDSFILDGRKVTVTEY